MAMLSGSWFCGVQGCYSCNGGQYHFCKFCGRCPSNHFSRHCSQNPMNIGYKSIPSTLILKEKGVASFVVPYQYNFKNTSRNAILLILEKSNQCATWIGGKIDPGESAVEALYRETTEEYGSKLTKEVRKSVGKSSNPNLQWRKSNMYVISVNSFSRNKTYYPEQYPSETEGAVWVYVDSLQSIPETSTYINSIGTQVVKMLDTDGNIREVSKFVHTVSMILLDMGYI